MAEVETTRSGLDEIARISDSGRKMTLVIDRAGNPVDRWRYSNGKEVPAYDRKALPCPTDCGGIPFTTKSVNMGQSIHLRQHQPLVRYLEPGQEDKETGEEPKAANGKFPWLLVGALAVGAFILFRNA
jgi:hypothetical protein